MSDAVGWTCPHCNRPTTITDNLRDVRTVHLRIGKTRHGALGLRYAAARCPNPDCNEPMVHVTVGRLTGTGAGEYLNELASELVSVRLLPEPAGKPQPDYIPQQLREDYREACRICELSPKAAATMARRCLQGIIRDFWGIKEKRLVDEIAALRDKIGDDLWHAIDAVRKVGNIGAHMEQDVDKIVDVEPGEAQKLIGLVELLFEEFYVARHQRQRRLAEVAALAADKENSAAGDEPEEQK